MEASIADYRRKFYRRALTGFVLFGLTTVYVFLPATGRTVNAQETTNQAISTTFSNPASIVPVDRPSNSAGTNPGVPAANYPSAINVAGLTGNITKVTVTFALTSTFPDDADILLVGPTGARSLVMSDAGGSGDITAVSLTFDQTAGAPLADGGTAAIPTGSYQPSNYAGATTPEPGGQDNFPTAGGLTSYPLGFNVFNGTNPNGTWNLYVVDDENLDTLSLPSGWSIDVTTGGGPVVPQHHVDFNGDGKTDFAVVRNTGGGAGGQITWFINLAGTATTYASAWGISTDFFIPEDYDGDDKTDIAIWRPGASGVASFYILNSNGNVLRVEAFGQGGDEPRVVGDYDGDGKADLAVYRGGENSGDPSTWYFRGSLNNPGGNVTYVPWGQNGDFPAPGDYDGDGKRDFVIQRNNGGGQAKFWMFQTTAGLNQVVFGTPTDVVVPGDYDGDGKTDIATARASAGQYQWYVRPSTTGVINGSPYAIFGASATDFHAQGDYDGDGKTDIAVWRSSPTPGASVFWVLGSTVGAFSVPFGQNTDYPVANYNRF
ncbi:MAG TPA: VCBS repeat-containing protein [Pyrinomonadaceae bacterium]|nr:VCBS repeat-containing protein [Pyrinomonadaceae bacterium]